MKTEYIPATELADFVSKSYGTVYLSGSHGGLALITGGVSKNGGYVMVPLEIGTINLDADSEIEVAVLDNSEVPAVINRDHQDALVDAASRYLDVLYELIDEAESDPLIGEEALEEYEADADRLNEALTAR